LSEKWFKTSEGYKAAEGDGDMMSPWGDRGDHTRFKEGNIATEGSFREKEEGAKWGGCKGCLFEEEGRKGIYYA